MLTLIDRLARRYSPAQLLAPSDADKARILRISAQGQHHAEPLRFAREVCPHHFTLAISRIHEQIVALTFPQGEDGDTALGQGSESPATLGVSTLPCSSPPLS